ncbi:uncharacterized protein B0H64DRAFT_408339 [Chaetomium fimeti]|uniref:C2H2-type domain-containing protein n=1 Tax=Chaetomium fimeti TaxID=1854472 RepID=A0AAE0LNE2_9PEZI|nr:hypothetical protein B0H64DRAFT_408339 [Chaetomium fimeti]
MEETIAVHVSRSLAAFRGLFEPTRVLNFPEPWIQRKIQDEQTKFKVWAGNIGAHKTGTGSLDYRLRDASPIKDQVIELLGELCDLLSQAIAIASGEKTPWDQLDDEEDVEDDDTDSPTTELGQIATEGVADVVDCLLRLSMTIRNPAPHDRFITYHLADTSYFEPFDIQHVQAKFSSVEPWLAERLGKATSRRRQYFRYRESHHVKLSQGVDDPDPTPKECNDTIASSIPTHLKDKGKQPTILEDDRSDAGASQTSYATSAADEGALRVPPLPEVAHEGPFQCPFCYVIIVATDRAAWKKHVYSDLRPYICLEKECTASNAEQEFSRRHEWMNHVQQNHWNTYPCLFGCTSIFSSPSRFKDHLANAHPDSVSQGGADALVKLAAQPLDIKEGIPCPICGDAEILTSANQYRRHVGRHQEQLSLFALPKSATDEDGEIESDDTADGRSLDLSFTRGEPASEGEAVEAASSNGSSNGVSRQSFSPRYTQSGSWALEGNEDAGDEALRRDRSRLDLEEDEIEITVRDRERPPSLPDGDKTRMSEPLDDTLPDEIDGNGRKGKQAEQISSGTGDDERHGATRSRVDQSPKPNRSRSDSEELSDLDEEERFILGDVNGHTERDFQEFIRPIRAERRGERSTFGEINEEDHEMMGRIIEGEAIEAVKPIAKRNAEADNQEKEPLPRGPSRLETNMDEIGRDESTERSEGGLDPAAPKPSREERYAKPRDPRFRGLEKLLLHVERQEKWSAEDKARKWPHTIEEVNREIEEIQRRAKLEIPWLAELDAGKRPLTEERSEPGPSSSKIDQRKRYNLGDVNSSDDTTDLDENEYQEYLHKRREERRQKRMASGSVNERAFVESEEEDNETAGRTIGGEGREFVKPISKGNSETDNRGKEPPRPDVPRLEASRYKTKSYKPTERLEREKRGGEGLRRAHLDSEQITENDDLGQRLEKDRQTDDKLRHAGAGARTKWFLGGREVTQELGKPEDQEKEEELRRRFHGAAKQAISALRGGNGDEIEQGEGQGAKEHSREGLDSAYIRLAGKAVEQHRRESDEGEEREEGEALAGYESPSEDVVQLGSPNMDELMGAVRDADERQRQQGLMEVNTTPKAPLHICKICSPPKAFTRGDHLRRHQLSHGIPPFTCEWCDKSFHRTDLLERHRERQ